MIIRTMSIKSKGNRNSECRGIGGNEWEILNKVVKERIVQALVFQ